MNIAAIILAGGRARRMGTPKHAVLLEGRALLDRTLDAVRGLPTVVVGPPVLSGFVSKRPSTSLTCERPASSGPVAAISAALDELDRRRVDAEAAVILSCDLAHPAEAVARLLSVEDGGDGRVLQDTDDRMQWLCGLYRLGPVRRALSRMRAASSLESAPARDLFGRLALRAVADPAGSSFDIDTPADLIAAIRGPDDRTGTRCPPGCPPGWPAASTV